MNENKRLDLLTSLSGMPIKTVEAWETYRRREIKVLLENFVYGVRPCERPEGEVFTLVRREKNWLESGATFKEIDIACNEHHFPAYIFVPENAPLPAPAFLTIMNEKRSLAYDFDKAVDYPHLPISEIVARGYAVAVMPTNAVSPDWMYYGGFKKGVFGAIQPAEKRLENSWATLSGWSFGAQLVMDYLTTDIDIDHKNVAVVGHSRDGKTALLTGMYDERIKLVISNSSGTGGAAYTRGKVGEHIRNLMCSDWFCDNYRNFKENEEMLPCDQHMLLAMIAPRPLYIKSDALDEWSDPEAELFSAKLASSVYELYGKKGIVVDDEIEVEKEYHEGMIAYHRSPIDHALTASDWHHYMNFADKHLKGQRL
ncbi:MAG: acetylxylan esterase [Clostridia bacterium]|nr:acetylxylan esterase [Clostridia bacterium]